MISRIDIVCSLLFISVVIKNILLCVVYTNFGIECALSFEVVK
jgi:hypothetical protein